MARLTVSTIPYAVLTTEVSGAVLAQARFFLGLPPGALAELLGMETPALVALERAGESAVVPPDVAGMLGDLVVDAVGVMRPAEMRGQRELLGLDFTHLAAVLRVNARRLERAEAGLQSISVPMRDGLAALAVRAGEQVAALVALLERRCGEFDSQGPGLLWTYASDGALGAALKDRRLDVVERDVVRASPSASWHRRVVTMAARAVPHTAVAFGEDDGVLEWLDVARRG